MTKADIVRQVSENTGIDKKEVGAVIESFMENVRESLCKNENVYLRGFGSFIVKRRASKVARNISKQTTIVIPAHSIPSFKPAKIFRESIKKLTDIYPVNGKAGKIMIFRLLYVWDIAHRGADLSK